MTQPPISKSNRSDRRSYFRIDDNVFLSYRQITEEELAEVLNSMERSLEDSFTLAANFSALSRKTKLLSRQVRRESPILADYVDALECKIDILARMLLLRDMGIDEKNVQEVNLSAGGMEFPTDEFMPIGSLLELRFMIFPSRTGILAGARVIRCNPSSNPKSSHTVATEFVHLRESDRQLILKHMLNRQSVQLRQSRFRVEDTN